MWGTKMRMNPVVARAKATRNRRFRPALLALALAGAFASAPNGATANPSGGAAVHGQASMATNGNQLTVTTQNGAASNHSAINWQSFSIPAGSATVFAQPNAASTVINRVVTNNPSAIFGSLQSNGRLVLVNQSGIAIGAGAVIDTAGFTASALRMSDADALAGRLRFGDAYPNMGGAGGITVDGRITARNGDVVLIAPNIDIGASALVQAPNGSTLLAAGRQVEITGRGFEGIRMLVQAPTDQVRNLGKLQGDAVGIFAGTLRHSGDIQATTASLDGGTVVLKATGDAYVEGSGKVLAIGITGGRVDVLGHRVAVMDNAVIDVSGQTGGGTIRIGGDYQGKNPSIQNADQSYFGPNATLKADALRNGNGGKVIVWADDTTRAHGSISVRGGEQGGDGGFVETSGHNTLAATRAPDLAAPKGKGGTWLLDPNDISISHATSAADVQITGSSPFSPTQSNSSVSGLTDFTINAALTSGDVVVTTTSSGTGSGAITFNGILGPVLIQSPASVARNLTLNATTGSAGVVFLQGDTVFKAGNLGSLNVNVGGTSDTFIAPTGVVTLDGTNGLVTATVSPNRTWYNEGLLQLNGNSQVNLSGLNTGNGLSFFNTSTGTVNVNSTNGFAFFDGGTQLATISNAGLFDVTKSTAFAVAFGQSPGGLLNVKDGPLNLQNANDIRGTVNLFPTGAAGPATINVNEFHGTKATFVGTNFPSPGTLAVGGSAGGPSQAIFSGVTAPFTTLQVGSGFGDGVIDFASGDTIFNNMTVAGGSSVATMTNANLGITGFHLTVPTIGAYSGNIGFFATGDVTLPSGAPIATAGNVRLVSGWDGSSSFANPVVSGNISDITIGDNLTAGGNASFLASRNITVSAPVTATGNVAVTANNDVHLTSGNVLVADNKFLNIFADVDNSGGGNVNIGAVTLQAGSSPGNSTGQMNISGRDINVIASGNGSAVVTATGAATQTISAANITFANNNNTTASLQVTAGSGLQTHLPSSRNCTS